MKNILLSAVCASVLILGPSSLKAQEADGEMMPPPPPHEMPMEQNHEMMKKHHDQMSKKLADDLGLTEEQKAQADKIREDGRKKMKPLMEEKKKLHEKMDALRKANMEEFEKILTPEQKQKFEEIKAKHKEKMPKFGKGFHGQKGKPFDMKATAEAQK